MDQESNYSRSIHVRARVFVREREMSYNVIVPLDPGPKIFSHKLREISSTFHEGATTVFSFYNKIQIPSRHCTYTTLKSCR